MAEKMQIGEVAELFGITPKTLRHYEEMGLVRPERQDNGYREYGLEEIRRLQRIRQLQLLGLSLRQIGDVLDRHGEEAVWSAVLGRLRQETDEEIAALEARRDRLDELMAGYSAGALEEFLKLGQEQAAGQRERDQSPRMAWTPGGPGRPGDLVLSGGHFNPLEAAALTRGRIVFLSRPEVSP
jgi:DNA-binding transcriptional MerR regulator